MGKDDKIWNEQFSSPTELSKTDKENIIINDQRRIRLTLKALKKTNTKGSKNRQALERSRAVSTTKKSSNPYSELEKIHLTSIDQIQKSAKVIHNLFKGKSGDKDRKDLGVPRPIFTSLVNQIVSEETAALASTNRDEYGHRNTLIPKVVMRPRSAPTTNRLDDVLQQPRAIIQNSKGSELIRPKSGGVIRKNLSATGFVDKVRQRKLLSVLEDEYIIKVRERKLYLQLEREKQIIYNINKKFHLDKEANDYWQRQKSWMAIILALKIISPMLSIVQKARDQAEMKRRFRKQTKSVNIITKWWSKIRIRRKFIASTHLLRFLRFFVVRVNAILKIRKRRAAVLLLRQFITDSSSGSKRVLAVYNFRKQCILVQRAFRSWFQIKQDRIRSLWMAMEKIIRRRHDEALKQARSDEIHALKNISAMEGFEKTLKNLNLMHKKIEKIVEKEQRIMKSVIRSQREEDKVLAELNKFKVSEKIEEVVVEAPKKEKKFKGKSWYQRKSEDHNAVIRLMILSEILKQQRRRHIRKEELELRRSKKIKMVYDLSEVKDFLLSDLSTNVPAAQKVESHKRKPFLLLTQGGIDSLEEIRWEKS